MTASGPADTLCPASMVDNHTKKTTQVRCMIYSTHELALAKNTRTLIMFNVLREGVKPVNRIGMVNVAGKF